MLTGKRVLNIFNNTFYKAFPYHSLLNVGGFVFERIPLSLFYLRKIKEMCFFTKPVKHSYGQLR